MTAIKPIVRALVSWMEDAYGDPTQGAGSDFAMEPSAEIMSMAELALAAAMNGKHPVYLATNWPVKSVIAGLVLQRAGVTRAQIFKGGFTDEQFEALTHVLKTVKESSLVIEPAVELPGYDTSPNH